MSDQILYYNWAPYFREPVVGGGISVYLRNLFDHLDGYGRGYTPSFLYSGFDYAPVSRRLRLERVHNSRHPRVRTFSLVNSPVPAPSLLSFEDPASSVSSPVLDERFARFLRRHGPFRIIHFHSLEGLTATCLKTAKESGARVVLSLHNYWPVCPQVQLWQFEARPCSDFLEGRACVSCLTDRVDTELTLAHRRMSNGGTLTPGSDPALRVKAAAAVRFRTYRRRLRLSSPNRNPLRSPWAVEGSQLPQLALAYRQRRKDILSLMNNHLDAALSVSERTTAIYMAYGLDPRLVLTRSIGSKAAEFRPPDANPAPYGGGQLRIAYLGESRKDKGFFFLLDELRRWSAEDLRRLDLVVACRVTDPSELRMAEGGRGRLLSLAQSLGRLTYHPGYTHANLPGILDGVHLGVVPALWEDNLPQVALEFLGCRVPVLCSDRGGAQEFVRHPAFIFEADADGDFRSKLRGIRDNPDLLTEFWGVARLPKSVEQHFGELEQIYRPAG
jgi:glycosyltransferase involved in cell wall biosynthesis